MTTEQQVSYEEALVRRFSRPGNALTRMPLVWRRGLVVLAAVLSVAALALPWLVEGPYQMLGLPLVFVVVLLSLLLSLATRTVAELPERMLDERTLQARNRASHRALRTVVYALSALMLLVLFTSPSFVEDGAVSMARITTVQLVTALLAVTLAGVGLPSWFLAWSQAPEPADDPVLEPAGAEPVGSLPWGRLVLQGALFATVMGLFSLFTQFDGLQVSGPRVAVIVGSALIGGAFFTLGMAAWARWVQRRL